MHILAIVIKSLVVNSIANDLVKTLYSKSEWLIGFIFPGSIYISEENLINLSESNGRNELGPFRVNFGPRSSLLTVRLEVEESSASCYPSYILLISSTGSHCRFRRGRRHDKNVLESLLEKWCLFQSHTGAPGADSCRRRSWCSLPFRLGPVEEHR